ncbi:hypothetical protein KQX64_03320 [Rhodopseudomonas palustris]|nr:hypothetical protein KQX64_03320 [Rhodopseudomonas palustris]
MSSIAAFATTPAIASPSIAAELFGDGDREVLELAARIIELKLEGDAANAAWQAADKAYAEAEPEIPDTLLWRVGDPVGYSGQVTRNGRKYMTCRLSDLELLKDRQVAGYWEFIGPESESASVTQDDFDRFGHPLPRVADLYRAVPNKRLADRKDQLITAADAYNRQCQNLRDELNWDALSERCDLIEDELWGLVKKLIVAPARSARAIRAKAIVVNRYKDELEELGEHGRGLIKSLLDDLIGTPPAAAIHA